MMESALPEDIAIRASGLGKCYRIYAKPKDRLLQAFWKRRSAFQEFWALRDVSFEVKRGETLGIIGRNGSGKSTLLQMICGTLTPTEGSVETSGRIAALLELGSGFNPEFTGLENVYVNASVLGLNRNETEQRLDDILAFAEIGDFIHQPVKTYSSGMQVRLAFAVASQINARCLIVDEALAVGDIVFSQKCFRFFKRFCNEGGTLLYVTHDLQSLSSFSTRGLWLSQGRQKFLGDTLNCIRRFTEDCLTGNSQLDESPAEQDKDGKHDQATSSTSHADQPLGITEDHHTIAKECQAASSSLMNSDLDASKIKHPETESYTYGAGGATILQVSLVGVAGDQLSTVVPLQRVRVCITTKLIVDVSHIIGGYLFFDSKGQAAFGDNSIGSAVLSGVAGETIETTFSFYFPWIRSGEYTVAASFSSGNTAAPTILHYIEHALTIQVLTGQRVIHGVTAPLNTGIAHKVQHDLSLSS